MIKVKIPLKNHRQITLSNDTIYINCSVYSRLSLCCFSVEFLYRVYIDLALIKRISPHSLHDFCLLCITKNCLGIVHDLC